MKETFGAFDTAAATPVTNGLDFDTLKAALAAAQAASPTARAMEADASVRSPHPTDSAIALFLGEEGWRSASSAMHGSFHRAAAGTIVDNEG
ncbi:hypothetical protein [Sphingomonas montanisoli]|uniref:Uncharacterized protein n=1 Tax=Sphingomonas montanisoli TaxID=2606412 RepID=A0A5D9CEZ6_9SPHN|nr:hypothetical protein [Sphingomonas montanisoli]TZG28665.1 hypothetical protein FYJ91_00485 [Sphingomonas montanisoli]